MCRKVIYKLYVYASTQGVIQGRVSRFKLPSKANAFVDYLTKKEEEKR